MIADEYDSGEESSPTNRTRSGEPFVVGGDGADRAAPAGASSEGFDADRIRGVAEDDLSDARGVAARVFRGTPRLAFTDHWACIFGTADETPNFSHSEAMCHV